MINLLEIDPVILTMFICIIGVSYRILTGMIGKKRSEFSIGLATTTFMVGIITSIGLVAPVVDALPDDSSSLVVLSSVAGLIATVMGVDAATRKGYKLTQQRKQNQEVNPN